MTREELKRHCLKQIESCERWARLSGQEPYGKIYEEYKLILELLEQEPKTGHWVEHPEIETSTPEYLMFYECSECGDKQCFCKSDIHKKRFCGNCGCRMVEPQERSEVMG